MGWKETQSEVRKIFKCPRANGIFVYKQKISSILDFNHLIFKTLCLDCDMRCCDYDY